MRMPRPLLVPGLSPSETVSLSGGYDALDFQPPTFCDRSTYGTVRGRSARDVLQTFALHQQRHMCLRLLQSALAALPVHLSIIVRVSTVGDGSSQRNELGDESRGVARRFRGS